MRRWRWRSSARRNGTQMTLMNADLSLISAHQRHRLPLLCLYKRPARRNKTTAATATTTPATANHIKLREEADVLLSAVGGVAVAASVDSGSTWATTVAERAAVVAVDVGAELRFTSMGCSVGVASGVSVGMAVAIAMGGASVGVDVGCCPTTNS